MAPDTPSLVAGHGRGSALLTPDGELLTPTASELATLLALLPPVLVVHAPATFARIGLPLPATRPCLDLLELFAFVLPARPAVPTPRGMAAVLGLPLPASPTASAAALPDIATALLERLAAAGRDRPEEAGAAAGLATRMGAAGWPWAAPVLRALGQHRNPTRGSAAAAGDAFKPWRKLPRWEDQGPAPPPSAFPVGTAEARRRLAQMLGPDAEARPGQADYADAASAAFAPREDDAAATPAPHVVLAEAGTGIGKTLGYVAPASLWAERNGGPVWVSTYTRHLQRQVEGELARLHPDAAERRRRVVVRKGRENYLCLLNLEERVQATIGGGGSGASHAAQVVPLGLVVRWILATDSGDVTGGDLPGWLPELFGATAVTGLADRRGECIHAACPHYKCCFIEHIAQRARDADLVIANHALVMAQAAWGGLDDDPGTPPPARYVFDEGHMLFDAADSAFAAELSGTEMAEVRRWLVGGAEGGRRARGQGLRRRIEDLVARWPELGPPLDAALLAASILPAQAWAEPDAADPTQPSLQGAGVAETPLPPTASALLNALRRQVLARDTGRSPGSSARSGAQECDLFPLGPGVAAAGEGLRRALGRIAEPLRTLEERLTLLLESEAAGELDTDARARIAAVRRMLRRRALDRLAAWDGILTHLLATPPEPGSRPERVLSLQLRERGDHRGRAWSGEGQRSRPWDAALRRHWLDPTVPFALTLAGPAHGLLVTSATLRDGGVDDAESAWLDAEARVGAAHLSRPALRVSVASPFDYASQARIFVVTDVGTGPEEVAGACRALFEAAGGGALGLFTSIGRLLEVHARIAPALERAGLPLLAQHVDAMGNATLVDVFRTEVDSCLLGTDAMRDGVDVPGRSLRLVVFDKVPWPRPDILHRERRVHLSGGDPRGYDDRVARLRLRQAFGRLVRSASDRGVFVLLDRRTPSRLLPAFPAGAPVRRVGLAEAVAGVQRFLSERATLLGSEPGGSTRAEPPCPAP